METGFNPVVVAPSLWRVQTETQQKPFRFGGSQVPPQRMSGMGSVMRINRPPKRSDIISRHKLYNENSGA